MQFFFACARGGLRTIREGDLRAAHDMMHEKGVRKVSDKIDEIFWKRMVDTRNFVCDVRKVTSDSICDWPSLSSDVLAFCSNFNHTSYVLPTSPCSPAFRVLCLQTMTLKMFHRVFALLATVEVVSSFLPQRAVHLSKKSIRRPVVEDSNDSVEAGVLAETRLQLLRQWGLDKRYGDKSGRNEAAKELLTLAKAGPAAIYLEDETDAVAAVDESTDNDATYSSEVRIDDDSYRSATTSTTPRLEVPADGLSKRERKKMAAERRKQTAAVFVAADPNAEAYLSSDPARRHLKAKNSNGDGNNGSSSKMSTDDALAGFELDLREVLGPSRPPCSALLQLEAWLTEGIPETSTAAALAPAQHTAVLLALAVEFELRAISADSPNTKSSSDRSSSGSSRSNDVANAVVRLEALRAYLVKTCAPTSAATIAADCDASLAAVPAVLRASQVNQLVRWFGRANAPRAALASLRLLDCTSTYGSADPSSSSSSSSSGGSDKDVAQFSIPMPNAESYEFLANAFVKDVVLEGAANSMARLPPPIPKDTPVPMGAPSSTKGGKVSAHVSRSMPLQEVLFVGRSNAGKSSLVNMLVGRKVRSNGTLVFFLVLASSIAPSM